MSLQQVKLREIQQEHFKGKKVILGIDDMDICKGIHIKLLAFEKLLESCEYLQSSVVLVQIVNPARSSGRDVQEVEMETYAALVPKLSINKTLGSTLIAALYTLRDDPKNTVSIVSGRGIIILFEWLAPCEGLLLFFEHAYFTRWPKTSDWQSNLIGDLRWKKVIEPIMKKYTEATNVSDIESKDNALVLHYQFADPNFRSCQAKELLDHLNGVLTKVPAVVRRGYHIVEVKPQFGRNRESPLGLSPGFALWTLTLVHYHNMKNF